MALTAQLTHFGVHATDLDRMVDFYTRVMGFIVSDSGTGRSGARVFFMTQNPECHHQFVLFDGRPQDMAYNPVNQISFRLELARHAEGLSQGADRRGHHRASHHRPRQRLGALLQGPRGQSGRALLRHAVLHAAAVRRAARSRPAERGDSEADRSDVPKPPALPTREAWMQGIRPGSRRTPLTASRGRRPEGKSVRDLKRSLTAFGDDRLSACHFAAYLPVSWGVGRPPCRFPCAAGASSAPRCASARPSR